MSYEEAIRKTWRHTEGALAIAFESTRTVLSSQFQAIPKRQCTRAAFDFALQAALGIRHTFINQPVEVSVLRSQFANALWIGSQRPDLVVRFGRGPEMPRSLRRPVQAVLI